MSNSLDDLFVEIENDLTEVVTNEVKEVVEKIMYEKSNEIYDKYKNWGKKPYNRRYENGGFGDEDNIHTDIKGDIKNGIELITTNDTKSNDKYADADAKGQYIDYIIEEGGSSNYTWRHVNGNGMEGRTRPYDFPEARPVTEWVIKELDSTNIVEKTIENKLKSKGYDIK